MRPVRLLVLWLALLGSVPARGQVPASRIRTIRTAIRAHRALTGTPTPLPSSSVLTNTVAAGKTYGDSWTCRSSTTLLLDRLARTNVRLKMVSDGKNTFKWGREGSVSYHYFAVDNPRRPSLLVDPTASSNFGSYCRPGGMMHGLLTEAGQKLSQPGAAARVARRIARGSASGLLVLTQPADIAVYREALTQAARRATQSARTAE